MRTIGLEIKKGRVFEDEKTFSNNNVAVSESNGNEAEQTDTAGVSENADSKTKQSDKETATDDVSDNAENVSEVQKPAPKRGRKKEQ